MVFIHCFKLFYPTIKKLHFWLKKYFTKVTSVFIIRLALTPWRYLHTGEMAEWSKAPVLKTGKGL